MPNKADEAASKPWLRLLRLLPKETADAPAARPTVDDSVDGKLDRAGIAAGCRFRGASLDGYLTPTRAHEAALAACRAAVANAATGDGLLLVGATGAGKTHLLVGMLREALRGGHSGAYVTAEGFFCGLRSREETGLTESRYLGRYARPDVLLLDDLHCLTVGRSPGEDSYQQRMLGLLLDERHFHRRPTFAATTLTPTRFRTMVGERLRRRLAATVVVAPALPPPDAGEASSEKRE